MPDVPGTSQISQIGARRRARELCLSLVFAGDVGRQDSDHVLEQTRTILALLIEQWDLDASEVEKLSAEIEGYSRRLAKQYFDHSLSIDELISQYSEGWTLARMPAVDRNILRIALAEMLYVPDVPVGVTIDESVELAKQYGTEDSSKFINGILGTVAREQVEEIS